MRGVIQAAARAPQTVHGTKSSEQAEVRLTAWPTYCWPYLWPPSAALNKRSSPWADRLRGNGSQCQDPSETAPRMPLAAPHQESRRQGVVHTDTDSPVGTELSLRVSAASRTPQATKSPLPLGQRAEGLSESGSRIRSREAER